MSKYSNIEKLNIINRIKKIKNKKTFIKLFNLINEDSPNIKFTKNSNGIFFNLNIFSDYLISKVIDFLDKKESIENSIDSSSNCDYTIE
mgnify:CR=1 FL=1